MDILIWLFIAMPYSFAIETIDYITKGVKLGYTKERWLLEKTITKLQAQLTEYLEFVKDDPKSLDVYEVTIKETRKLLEECKSLRDGNYKTKSNASVV